MLDGHFFTYICFKNCNDVYLKRLKINEKEAWVGPFKIRLNGLTVANRENNVGRSGNVSKVTVYNKQVGGSN